jgi:hypothetical protein
MRLSFYLIYGNYSGLIQSKNIFFILSISKKTAFLSTLVIT